MASGIELDFQIQEQKQSMWCWAAVGASFALYYDKSTTWTQCKIVATSLGYPEAECCAGMSKCNKTGKLSQINDKRDTGSLQITGVLESEDPNILSFTDLKNELDEGRPLAFGLQLTLKKDVEHPIGHFVVIAGYREVGEKQLVTVYDPIPGSGYAEMTYDTFLHDYKCYGEKDEKISQYGVTHTYFTRKPVHS